MSEPASIKKSLTLSIKQKSEELGFFACGIAPAQFLEDDKKHFESWLAASNHAEMKFLERNRETRYDPRMLLEGACSVIVVLQNYYPGEFADHNGPRIAKYAYGDDYHHVIRNKLDNITSLIKKNDPEAGAEAFVDSAQLFEKRWAQKAGLGWIGKNSILINRKGGSFFYLGVILTTLELDYDDPERELCGDCEKCMDACPTGALNEPYHIDARKCIAYLTIEHKNAFGAETPGDFKNYIYGCDICQDACPWNRFARPCNHEEINVNKELINLSPDDWRDMSKEVFDRIAEKSCIKRTGLDRLKRNVAHVMKRPL